MAKKNWRPVDWEEFVNAEITAITHTWDGNEIHTPSHYLILDGTRRDGEDVCLVIRLIDGRGDRKAYDFEILGPDKLNISPDLAEMLGLGDEEAPDG